MGAYMLIYCIDNWLSALCTAILLTSRLIFIYYICPNVVSVQYYDSINWPIRHRYTSCQLTGQTDWYTTRTDLDSSLELSRAPRSSCWSTQYLTSSGFCINGITMTQLWENPCSAKLQNTTKLVACDLVQTKQAKKNGGREQTLGLAKPKGWCQTSGPAKVQHQHNNGGQASSRRHD